MASRRRILAIASHRVLYAGDDIALTGKLKALNCFVVRSPVTTASTLIRSDVKYSLLLFDQTAAGEELERLTRTLPHREHTPVIVVKKSEGLGRLLDTIRRRLGTI